MQRIEYNKNILKKSTDLLKSRDVHDRYDGVILAAYLIEQTFKFWLKQLNPLLYFGKRSRPPEFDMRIILKKLSDSEIRELQTSTARDCIDYMCEYKADLKKYKSSFGELFQIRNYMLHSIDDLPYKDDEIIEIAVSALRVCQKYISRYLGIKSKEFNPLTSQEFDKLQEKAHRKRIVGIRDKLKHYNNIFKQLSKKEVGGKISMEPEFDKYTWKEATDICPACDQTSLYKISYVDFDSGPDGVSVYGGSHWECRVCGLLLSEYEYDIATSLKI